MALDNVKARLSLLHDLQAEAQRQGARRAVCGAPDALFAAGCAKTGTIPPCTF
jgi:hypothetical protein